MISLPRKVLQLDRTQQSQELPTLNQKLEVKI